MMRVDHAIPLIERSIPVNEALSGAAIRLTDHHDRQRWKASIRAVILDLAEHVSDRTMV